MAGDDARGKLVLAFVLKRRNSASTSQAASFSVNGGVAAKPLNTCRDVLLQRFCLGT